VLAGQLERHGETSRVEITIIRAVRLWGRWWTRY